VLGDKSFLGQDYQEAARWWRLAAENGKVESQYNLGVLYAKGLGVQKDYQEAARWYRKAAEQSQAQAQYSLANLYALGLGVEADHSEAAQWYRKAADQGLPQAQYNLGVLLENGQGIAAAPSEAIQWYRLAAGWGLAQAQQKLVKLEGGLSPPVSAPLLSMDDQGLAQIRRQPTQPEADSSPLPASVLPAPIKGKVNAEAWIKAQNPEHFTLQLSTASSKQAIIDLIKGQEKGAYFKRQHQGKTQYTAIYGVFKSHDSAVKARAALPATMQRLQPWVRKFAAVQKLLRP
jgi:TPR repeat protein